MTDKISMSFFLFVSTTYLILKCLVLGSVFMQNSHTLHYSVTSLWDFFSLSWSHLLTLKQKKTLIFFVFSLIFMMLIAGKLWGTKGHIRSQIFSQVILYFSWLENKTFYLKKKTKKNFVMVVPWELILEVFSQAVLYWKRIIHKTVQTFSSTTEIKERR